jgi:hypothetical protein
VQSGKSNSPWKSLRTLYSTLGLKGLYRGWTTMAIRESMYYAPYFLTYELLRGFFKSRRDPIHDHAIFSPVVVTESLISGGISGCVGWFVIMPSDYVKSVIYFLLSC